MSEKKNFSIDMHNRITAAELEKIIRMQLTALAEAPEMAAVMPPLMVWGAPGLGKSTVIRSVPIMNTIK